MNWNGKSTVAHEENGQKRERKRHQDSFSSYKLGWICLFISPFPKCSWPFPVRIANEGHWRQRMREIMQTEDTMCLRYFAVSDFVVWSKWESEEERKRVFIGGKKSGVPFSHTHTLRLWTGIDSIIPPNSSPKTARKNTSSLLWTQKWELFDRIVISNRLYPLHQAREWEIKFDYWRKEGIYIVGWWFRLSDSIRRCFDGYLICFPPFVFFVFLCPESDLFIENWLSSLNLLMYRDNFALADVTDLQQASKMVADGHLSKVSTQSYFSIIFARMLGS